jgi:hypothetical protein
MTTALTQLRAARKHHAEAKAALKHASRERDRLVMRASALGHSRREVAEAAGFKAASRVQQILDRGPDDPGQKMFAALEDNRFT